MSKFTPGPWAVRRYRETSTVHKKSDAEFTIAYVLCESLNEEQRNEDIGNAYLIASAPDLLAICEEVRRIGKILSPGAQAAAIDRIADTVICALAKAKGENP